MQDVENNMDDLFKRAAEHYPLQPGNGDWESIAKKLNDESPEPFPMPLNIKISKNIIALFALIILATGWFMFHNSNLRTTKLPLSNQKVHKNSRQVTEINDTGTQWNEKSVHTRTLRLENNNYRKKMPVAGTHHPVKLISQIGYGTGGYNIDTPAKDEPGIGHTDENDFVTAIFISPGDNLKMIANNFSKDLGDSDAKKMVQKANDITITGLNATAEKDAADTAGSIKKAKSTSLSREKRIYLGLLVGPDFSKVRSTSFNNVGLDAALLLGFRLNKRLSFETGIGRNKKNYTSDGKMFKMDKIGPTMPPGMVINNLESQSSLIEIPLKVRYDFMYKKSFDFFISGGVSAYIMTMEKNHYNTTLNGLQEKLAGVYGKNDYGLPAVVNITVGYERKIYGDTRLRIEPFIKIPLQGMGIGSLPVTSAGLQVGLTRVLK